MASDILSKYVAPGSKVDIQAIKRIKYDELQSKQKMYKTQVFDILSEDRIELLMPMEQTKLVLLPVGSEHILYFYSENGLYQCRAKIVDRYKKGSTYLLVFDIISNLRKEQRREYYRFSCALDMNSRELEDDEIVAIEKSSANEELLVPGLPLKRSIVADISGGGIRFIADYSYEINQLILCRYQLDTVEGPRVYEVTGRVLAVRELDNKPGMYEHRVQYVAIDKEVQEEIIKFIFEKERNELKRKD